MEKPFAMHDYNRVFPAGIISDNSLLDGGALTFWTGSITDWQNLQMAINSALDGAVIKLDQSVDASYTSDAALHVDSSKNITIDLNGNTINRSLLDRDVSVYGNNGYVIRNEGTLTITDSVGGGTITGGNCKGDAGGILNTGTLTLNGVKVSGNQATGSGGGIHNTGTLTINDGSIIASNAADYHGGGVYNMGTLTLNGGSITGNTAGRQGGGILQNGVMNISGAPVVSGSSASSGSNIYLRAEHPAMTVIGALTDGADLYVTNASAASAVTSGYGAKNGETDPGLYIHPDDTSLGAFLRAGEVYLEEADQMLSSSGPRTWSSRVLSS